MKSALKILFVTPYVPSSVRVRPYAFIRELAKRGHRVTLVCLVQPAWEAQYLSEVQPFCEVIYPIFLSRFESYVRTLTSLPTQTPLSVAFCRSEPLDLLLEHLNRQENFDLIHTEFMRAAPSTLHLNGRPKVYDAVDSLTLAYWRSLSAAHVHLVQRLVALVEWLKMRRYEPSILPHYDRLLVSSPADKEAMLAAPRRTAANHNVTVIPNGVDMEQFSYQDGPREPETIVFVGKMSYYVNVASVLWFYRQVLPLIRRQRPNVKLQIVGRNPSSKILALKDDPNVEVTGTVPDVRPYLTRAAVAICPMVTGAGIQNKMLEAMAVGAPCVSTSLACQALQIVPGQEVMVADSAENFAEATLELLGSPGLRGQVAEKGRRYVEKYHAWDQIGDCLNQVYDSLV